MFRANELQKVIAESSNKGDLSPSSQTNQARNRNLVGLGIHPENYGMTSEPLGHEDDTRLKTFGHLPDEVKSKILFEHLGLDFIREGNSVIAVNIDESPSSCLPCSWPSDTKNRHKQEYIECLKFFVDLPRKGWNRQEFVGRLLNLIDDDKIEYTLVKPIVLACYVMHHDRVQMLTNFEQEYTNNQTGLKKRCTIARAYSFLLPEEGAKLLDEVTSDIPNKFTTGEITEKDEISAVTKAFLSFEKGQKKAVDIVCNDTVAINVRKDIIEAIGNTKDTKLYIVFKELAKRRLSDDRQSRHELNESANSAYAIFQGNPTHTFNDLRRSEGIQGHHLPIW